jgi:hypothetical protein
VIQRKVQAEPGPVVDGGDAVSPRWMASGWTIFNNKCKPVKQYEPFFSADHAFQFGVTAGVGPTLFYDPVGRVVATLHPNHTWEKVIFDPWRQTGYDVNDTALMNPVGDPHTGDFFRRLPDDDYLPTWHALRTDPAHAPEALARWPDAQRREDEAGAAAKTAAHADTPAVVQFDSLGRPILSIVDNGPDGRYQTRTEQDIEGDHLVQVVWNLRLYLFWPMFVEKAKEAIAGRDEEPPPPKRFHEIHIYHTPRHIFGWFYRPRYRVCGRNEYNPC